MRITFVLPGMAVSGGIRTVFEISHGLKNRGHKVNIVYPVLFYRLGQRFSLENWITRAILTLKYLISGVKPDWLKKNLNLIPVLTISPQLINFWGNKIPDADIVIATSWETAYSVNKLNPKKGKKVYFIQHYENWEVWDNQECWEKLEKLSKSSVYMPTVWPQKPSLQKLKKLVDTTYNLPFFKITTSTWLAELLEKNFSGKVTAKITLGNNFEVFYPENKPLKNDKKKISMPYRRMKWKGYNEGLEALKMVRQEFPDIEITVFGISFGKKFPIWVKFYENPQDTLLRRLYSQADVFVFPSWVEGFGLPPMEAMACATACVTTDVGAVSDYTIPGKTAMIIPPRNSQKLAEGILALLKDDKKRKQMAKAGFGYIQKFTWGKTINQFEKALIDIFQSRERVK